MIAFLKGQLYRKLNQMAYIDCQGVGYGVYLSSSSFEALPLVGEQVFLEIYHHISENEQRLYGFSSLEEKQLFELIITVKGIGPKLGQTVLSGLPPADLQQAIATGDLRVLSSISGIGKKTAERIILELKEKVGGMPQASTSAGGAFSGGSHALADEAVSALQALGYRRTEADKAVSEAIKSGEAFEDSKKLIKKALLHLNR